MKGTSSVGCGGWQAAAASCLALISFGILRVAFADAAPLPAAPGIFVVWPDGWQMAPLSPQGAALNLHARQLDASGVSQMLQITAVPADASPHPVTPATLRQTVEKLRDSVAPTAAETQIDLHPFHHSQGYYFTMTDKHPSGKPNDFPQMVEGIFLSSGYLINVTLLTRDAKSADTAAIVKAFETIVLK